MSSQYEHNKFFSEELKEHSILLDTINKQPEEVNLEVTNLQSQLGRTENLLGKISDKQTTLVNKMVAKPESHSSNDEDIKMNRQLPAYIFMCITAGVCEEIIFRGFLITYTKTFFSSDLPAVVIPASVFALAHYYQRTLAVIKIFVLSLLFGIIFLESGSLWIVMFLHFAIDLAGGLIFLKYYKKEELKGKVDTTETTNEAVQDNEEPRH
jgi:hypothetical protein